MFLFGYYINLYKERLNITKYIECAHHNIDFEVNCEIPLVSLARHVMFFGLYMNQLSTSMIARNSTTVQKVQIEL